MPNRFRFRLERVLRIRVLEEEQAQKAWLAARQRYEEALESLNRLEQERLEIVNFGYEQSDLLLRQAMYTYLERMDRAIVEQKNIVLKTEQDADRMKEEYLAARQKREVLERLRERKFEEYRYEQALQEQKQMDELAGQTASGRERR